MVAPGGSATATLNLEAGNFLITDAAHSAGNRRPRNSR